MKSRRRTILKAAPLILLIAGATLNVAVAWGCALWARVERPWDQYYRSAPEVPDDFRKRVPQDWLVWPDTRTSAHLDVGTERADGFGVRIIRHRSILMNLAATALYRGNQHCVINAGWPLLALETEGTVQWSGALVPSIDWRGGMDAPEKIRAGTMKFSTWFQTLPRPIPLRPLWPGFAVNTLFYAGVLWMLCCGPFALRRMIRRRRGQCAHCAYPIGQSPVCTECGSPHAVTPKS